MNDEVAQVRARGRCLCGSVQFAIRGDSLAWFQSSLDEPTGLKLAVHSRTAESADYWNFDSGMPRKPGPSGLRGP